MSEVKDLIVELQKYNPELPMCFIDITGVTYSSEISVSSLENEHYRDSNGQIRHAYFVCLK